MFWHKWEEGKEEDNKCTERIKEKNRSQFHPLIRTQTHVYPNLCKQFSIYSGPSSYDRHDIRTTWVTTKILVLTYDQILSYDPHSGQGHLSYDPHGVRKLQSEPRYVCLWT
jgi:hypothetical protein